MIGNVGAKAYESRQPIYGVSPTKTGYLRGKTYSVDLDEVADRFLTKRMLPTGEIFANLSWRSTASDVRYDHTLKTQAQYLGSNDLTSFVIPRLTNASNHGNYLFSPTTYGEFYERCRNQRMYGGRNEDGTIRIFDLGVEPFTVSNANLFVAEHCYDRAAYRRERRKKYRADLFKLATALDGAVVVV